MHFFTIPLIPLRISDARCELLTNSGNLETFVQFYENFMILQEKEKFKDF